MHQSTRNHMKGAIIALLNKSLQSQGLFDVRVTELSDDFETATVMHMDGTKGVIKPEIILPLEEEHYVGQLPINRGPNAQEVQRIRTQRVRG